MDLLEKERIVQKNILEIFKENFDSPKTEQDILDFSPPKDLKTSIEYYETIIDIFLIEPEHLQHIKGCVKETIKKVAKLWDTTPHSFNPW